MPTASVSESSGWGLGSCIFFPLFLGSRAARPRLEETTAGAARGLVVLIEVHGGEQGRGGGAVLHPTSHQGQLGIFKIAPCLGHTPDQANQTWVGWGRPDLRTL